MQNPLLQKPQGPHGAYPFDVIKPEHFMPALEAALETARKGLDEYKKNPGTDFHHVVVEKGDITEQVDYIAGIFFNLHAAECGEELEKISKLKDTNDRLEDFFNSKREEWSKMIQPLFDVLKFEITTKTSQQILDTQALCLSYRQSLTEQISIFLDKRSKQDVKLKRIKQDKFIWYATSFGVKTNMGEKTLLIEAHVSEETRNVELIENYIEFLRQTNKNLESLQFTIKNIIELFNYLGR